MRLPRPARAGPRVSLTALIDVVFLLLIFIVLVARFVDQERLDLDVPTADAGRPAEMDALLVGLLDDGTVRVGTLDVGPAELQAALTEARRHHARTVVVADADTPLQRVVDVVSAARAVGFVDVAVATRPP